MQHIILRSNNGKIRIFDLSDNTNYSLTIAKPSLLNKRSFEFRESIHPAREDARQNTTDWEKNIDPHSIKRIKPIAKKTISRLLLWIPTLNRNLKHIEEISTPLSKIPTIKGISKNLVRCYKMRFFSPIFHMWREWWNLTQNITGRVWSYHKILLRNKLHP